MGVVVSVPGRNVAVVTVCNGVMVGVGQVDEDGPGLVSAGSRTKGASKRLLPDCC